MLNLFKKKQVNKAEDSIDFEDASKKLVYVFDYSKPVKFLGSFQCYEEYDNDSQTTYIRGKDEELKLEISFEKPDDDEAFLSETQSYTFEELLKQMKDIEKEEYILKETMKKSKEERVKDPNKDNISTFKNILKRKQELREKIHYHIYKGNNKSYDFLNKKNQHSYFVLRRGGDYYPMKFDGFISFFVPSEERKRKSIQSVKTFDDMDVEGKNSKWFILGMYLIAFLTVVAGLIFAYKNSEEFSNNELNLMKKELIMDDYEMKKEFNEQLIEALKKENELARQNLNTIKNRNNELNIEGRE